MKLSVVEEKPVPPPKRVVLDLSEEEADLIRVFANYYANRHQAAVDLVHGHAGAASQLAKKLAPFTDKRKYPFEKAFQDE